MIPPVERIIGDSGLSVADGKIQLDVRLPWYRSLPLSVIEIASLQLDGVDVPLNQVQLKLGNETWSLAEAKERVDRFWYVLDSVFLILPENGLQRGTQHEVTCSISIHPPYIAGLKRTNTMTQTLTIR